MRSHSGRELTAASRGSARHSASPTRLLRGGTLQNALSHLHSCCQVLLPFSIEASFSLLLLLFSKSGIRTEAGSSPGDPRTLAENTSKVFRRRIRLPSACDPLGRMPAQAVGLDGRTVNKQKRSECCPHTEKDCGMGTMKVILPSILSFI